MKNTEGRCEECFPKIVYLGIASLVVGLAIASISFAGDCNVSSSEGFLGGNEIDIIDFCSNKSGESKVLHQSPEGGGGSGAFTGTEDSVNMDCLGAPTNC